MDMKGSRDTHFQYFTNLHELYEQVQFPIRCLSSHHHLGCQVLYSLHQR